MASLLKAAEEEGILSPGMLDPYAHPGPYLAAGGGTLLSILLLRKMLRDAGISDESIRRKQGPAYRLAPLSDMRSWDQAYNPSRHKQSSVNQYPDIEKIAGPLISRLQEAKSRSDVRDWAGKTAILHELISRKPDDWYVDSDDDDYVVGLTHRRTGFRFHLPRKFVPAALQTGKSL